MEVAMTPQIALMWLKREKAEQGISDSEAAG